MLQDNLLCCKTGLLTLSPTQELQFDAVTKELNIFLQVFFSTNCNYFTQKKSTWTWYVDCGFFNADKNHVAFSLF